MLAATLSLDALAHRLRSGDTLADVLASVLTLALGTDVWIPTTWAVGLDACDSAGATIMPHDRADLPTVLIAEHLQADPDRTARTLVHEAAHCLAWLADWWDEIDDDHGEGFAAACWLLAQALGLRPPDADALVSWPLNI